MDLVTKAKQFYYTLHVSLQVYVSKYIDLPHAMRAALSTKCEIVGPPITMTRFR